MLFEISNPSDAYGIEGDETVCGVAVLILSQGQYGLKVMDEGDRQGETILPLFLFGGHEVWLEEKGIADLGTYLDEHGTELANALDTVTIAPDAYAIAKACLPEGTDLSRFRAVWHDKHRSSLNDIGQAAWNLAAQLRGRAERLHNETEGTG